MDNELHLWARQQLLALLARLLRQIAAGRVLADDPRWLDTRPGVRRSGE